MIEGFIIEEVLRLEPLSEREIALFRRLLSAAERFFSEHPEKANNAKEQLTMTLVTTNDNAVRLRPSGLDRDGVSVVPTGLEVTVDNPAIASVAADPNNPGAFLITPLPATDPNVGSRTVVVTTLDPNTKASVTTTLEFDAGVETSLVVNAEIVPDAAPAGDGTGGSGDAGNGVAAT